MRTIRVLSGYLAKGNTKTAGLHCLFYTKCLYHSLESKKRKGNNAGGDQRNRGILKRFWDPSQQYPLPQTGKKNQCQPETGSVTERGDQGLDKGVLFLDIGSGRPPMTAQLVVIRGRNIPRPA